MSDIKAEGAVLAAAQSVAIAGDIEANIAAHLRMMEIAADMEVNFLMFPELSLTGYEPGLMRDLAMSADDPRLEPLREMAMQREMVTLVGVPLAGPAGQVLIAALTFGADGGLSVYTKQHLHQGEEAVFSPGTGGAPVLIQPEHLALAVCADFSQATHAQAAAQSGATVYAASVLISTGGYQTDSALLSGYAREHRMAVLMANHGGPTGGWTSAGRSAFWSENGERIGEASAAGDCLLVVQRTADGWSSRSVVVSLR
jgi:predicted amidohydrolase